MTEDSLRATRERAAESTQLRRLARAYLRSRRLKDRFVRLIQSLHTGFWLGVLSHSDLDSVDDAYYVGGGRRRESPIDYGSTEYNKSGLFGWERTAFETHFPAGGSIALVGAGGGREVLALRHMSFLVDAWECQPELVAAANELLIAEGFEPTVAYAPRNTIVAGPMAYDAAVVGWGAYSLIQGRGRRVALLRQLRAQVKVGSPMLVSFVARRPGNVHFRIEAGVGNIGRRIFRRKRLEVGDSLDPNFMHWFVAEEVTAELSAGGFELTYFSATPYGHAIARAVSPADGQ